jgi:acyl dehydratase
VIVGRSYPASEPYLVGREKVREFAAAVGEDSPLCHESAAARAAGHPDLVAPPTFPIVFALPACEPAIADPDLGVDYSRVVHADQGFTYTRPVHAGDELVSTVTVASHKVLAGNVVVGLQIAVSTTAGEPVVIVDTALVSRAAE